MKLLLLNILTFVFTVNIQPSCLIKGKRFKGYVFDKEHFVLMNIDDQSKRYTPNKQDVFLVESLIKDRLKSMNVSLENQGGECPVIHKNLKKYVRQYVGFVTKNGERVVWINFIWKPSMNDEERLPKDIVTPLDGCSHYWNIKVNLDKGEVFDLIINGSA